jgi:hypothetical protein
LILQGFLSQNYMNMKCLNKLLTLLYLIGYGLTIQAQNTIPAAGGNASGGGGSVSYTVGQVTYQFLSETTGSVAQGVQQPYEISVLTAIENTGGITLDYKVYPNPTAGIITLAIRPFDNENLRYRLYDLNGILLLDKKIESEVTEISLQDYSYSMYFLKVIRNNQEIKVFKIIKK